MVPEGIYVVMRIEAQLVLSKENAPPTIPLFYHSNPNLRIQWYHFVKVKTAGDNLQGLLYLVRLDEWL